MSLRQVAFFTLIAAMTVVQLALGFWQWGRRSEKLAFIAGIERAAEAAPKVFGTHQIWDRVTISGRYLPEKTAYIRTSRPAPKPGERDKAGKVPVSGFGVLVMTAFELQRCTTCASETLLVNRGFLSTPPNGTVPAIETPNGSVTITGFWRASEKEGLFPPKNDPAKGVFFFRSIDAIALYLGLPQSTTHAGFLDRQAEASDLVPPSGIEVEEFLKAIPNNHFEYAMTWWALAATNIIICLIIRFGARTKRADTSTTIR